MCRVINSYWGFYTFVRSAKQNEFNKKGVGVHGDQPQYLLARRSKLLHYSTLLHFTSNENEKRRGEGDIKRLSLPISPLLVIIFAWTVIITIRHLRPLRRERITIETEAVAMGNDLSVVRIAQTLVPFRSNTLSLQL